MRAETQTRRKTMTTRTVKSSQPAGFSGRHDGDGVRVPAGFDIAGFAAEAEQRCQDRRARQIYEQIDKLSEVLGVSKAQADQMLAESSDPRRLILDAASGLVKLSGAS
jgi:hypothetical protein